MKDEIDDILAVLESNNPQEGIEEAKNYLEENEVTAEEQSTLVYGIAVGYFKLGSYQNTVKWLKKTDDERRWLLAGYAYRELEEFSKSAGAFGQAAEEIEERTHEAKILQGQALILAGDIDRARDIFDQLIEEETQLEPDARAEVLLARGMVEMEEEKPKKAREWFDEIIEEHEETGFAGEAAFYLTQIHENIGQIDKALEYAQWMKDNGNEQQWEEVAAEYLKRLHKHKRNREDKMRGYEY
ncbi:MAG: tetratricopeptide repeat protein [bacterium]